MRLIDADVLTEDILISFVKSDRVRNDMLKHVQFCPTLTFDDIVPHGRWIANELGYLECPHCKWERRGIPLVEHYFYCPNCGAKMDLEE